MISQRPRVGHCLTTALAEFRNGGTCKRSTAHRQKKAAAYENDIEFVKERLICTKEHLCNNKDEADNFHPNWITIPSDVMLKRAICLNNSAESAFVDLLVGMCAPLCLAVGVNLIDEMCAFKKLNYDLRMLFCHLQAKKINAAFKDKYGVEFSTVNVAEDYRACRLEGVGREQLCCNLHLGYFGEYEGCECDYWSLETNSMIDVGVDDPPGICTEDRQVNAVSGMTCGDDVSVLTDVST